MLDHEHAAFLQTGVSISLAACAPDGAPSVSRGVGCKLLDNGQVAVFVRRSQAQALLENIRHNGRIANVFSLPSSNRTVQLKGVDARVVPFDAADLALIETHTTDFIRQVTSLGLAERIVRTVLAYTADDLATVVYTPSAPFSQTPGPKAGEPLPGTP